MKKYFHQVQEHYLVFKQKNSGFDISSWKQTKLSSTNIFQFLSKPINSDIRELLKPQTKRKQSMQGQWNC